MSAAGGNGDKPRREPLPPVGYELQIPNATIGYVDRADGGIELCITPLQAIGPGQFAMVPPRIRIGFDPVGWERFKREVAADGAQSGIFLAPPGTPT